jgi:hypothetical protein
VYDDMGLFIFWYPRQLDAVLLKQCHFEPRRGDREAPQWVGNLGENSTFLDGINEVIRFNMGFYLCESDKVIFFFFYLRSSMVKPNAYSLGKAISVVIKFKYKRSNVMLNIINRQINLAIPDY